MERMFLPSIHVRGTHYQVGYDIGKTFKSMIEEHVNQDMFLHKLLLPAYDTSRGKEAYEDCLNLMKRKFPFYIKELEGISDGSQVPFHLLMLLHVCDVVLDENGPTDEPIESRAENGCSSVLCNQKDIVLGHTEDFVQSALHNCYVIHADITDTDIDGCKHNEKFTSFCYPGSLPGYCMNVNRYGFVFTINTILPSGIYSKKTPASFLTRALLSAKTLEDALTILRDSGTGTAHGFNVNMAFIKQGNDTPFLFHTVEVGPGENAESQLSLLNVSPGETHVRCNMYLRLKIPECEAENCFQSSLSRHRVMNKIGLPHTMEDVINLLSNQDDPDYPIYRQGSDKDMFVTVAIGIFDFKKNEWQLYKDSPITSEPVVTFPIKY